METFWCLRVMNPERDGTAAETESAESEWTEHLAELRRRIIAVLAVFTVAALSAFVFSDKVAAFLLAPVSSFGVKLYTFNPAEKFVAYLHLSVWTGAVVTSPFLLLQAGLFVWPALRGKERRYTLAAILAVPLLFLSGAAAAYWFLSPVVLRFFLSFSSFDGIQPLWGFREYLGVLYALMIAAGLLLKRPCCCSSPLRRESSPPPRQPVSGRTSSSGYFLLPRSAPRRMWFPRLPLACPCTCFLN